RRAGAGHEDEQLPERGARGRSKKLIELLLYSLEQGPVEQGIIARCIREGLPLPQAIQNAPELLPGLALYYNAYVELDSCRPFGLGPGPIPWTAVEQYAQLLGFDREQTEDLHHHVRAMDRAYLEHWRSKR